MRLIRWTPASVSSVLASAALLSAPLSSASAVERNLFTWSGKIDREVLIQIRGRDIATRGSGLDASWVPRVNVNQALPKEDGLVRAYIENGRGDVDVIENPSARNFYTATIRVRDSRAGADDYRVVVTYEANDIRDNPGRGRGNGRDNGDWNRDRDGNRDGNRDRDDRNNNDRDGYDRGRRDAGALRWSGLVDGVVDIRIQGGRIDALNQRGAPLRGVRYDVVGAAMPRRDVRLEFARQDGRGTIRIVQQPSVWNNYVAIVRIEDARPGDGSYSFDIRW